MATTYKLKSPAILRKGLRAYIGIHATAFERAQARYTQLRSARVILIDALSEKGESLEGYAGTGFKTVSDAFVKTYNCGTARTQRFLPKSARVQITKLETEIAELNDMLASLTKKAKPTKAKPAKKATVKTEAKTARHIPYFEAVLKYDAKASEDVVRKIVNHCGIALSNNDGKFVACSDESERATVRASWLVKKLDLTASDAELDTKVLAVCETMKADRMKNRVTFYYLLAKTEGKLSAL